MFTIPMLLFVVMTHTFSLIQIPSASFSKNDNEDFYYLPNEFPKLSPVFNSLLDKESTKIKYNYVKSLESIIGYLPFPEQAFYALQWKIIYIYLISNIIIMK